MMQRIKDHQYLYRRGDSLIFRRAVPEDARSAFAGRHEVHVSLRTASVAEARHRLLREVMRFEARVARARGERADAKSSSSANIEPTPIEMEEGVRTWFAERVTRYHTDYSAPQDASAGTSQLRDIDAHVADLRRSMRIGGGPAALTTVWIAETLADGFHWTFPDNATLHKLHRLIARGQIEGAERHRQALEGEPVKETDLAFTSNQYHLDEERRRERGVGRPVSIVDLFEGYVRERRPAPATIKAWRRQLGEFVAFLKHDNARDVTHIDVIAWKDHLLQKPTRVGGKLSARTIRDTYLPAVKAAFGWGVNNGRIEENPASKARVLGPRVTRLRDPDLNDDEAAVILRATFLPAPTRLTAERALARRWVPWLCAYTGARVNEITQLRAEDVRQIEEVWTIRITPEAGSTKDAAARIVALHPHLIDQGFLDIVACQTGHLFFDPARRRGGSDGNPQSKKVGEHLAA